MILRQDVANGYSPTTQEGLPCHSTFCHQYDTNDPSGFGIFIPLFLWHQQLIQVTQKQLLQNRVLSEHYLLTQMIHSNQIKMRKRLHHSLPMLYLRFWVNYTESSYLVP